jgi:predicted nucleotidyltransferase
VLFGSRARGDAAPHSDLDVLVILNTPVGREVEDYVNDCAWEVGLEHGIVVVPVTVSRLDWEEGLLSSSLLAIAVRQEGVTV